MTPERHQQIKQLFLAACQLEDSRRSAFLEQACGEDRELRAEVESLLAHHNAATLLETETAATLPTEVAEQLEQRLGNLRSDIPAEGCIRNLVAPAKMAVYTFVHSPRVAVEL